MAERSGNHTFVLVRVLVSSTCGRNPETMPARMLVRDACMQLIRCAAAAHTLLQNLWPEVHYELRDLEDDPPVQAMASDANAQLVRPALRKVKRFQMTEVGMARFRRHKKHRACEASDDQGAPVAATLTACGPWVACTFASRHLL